MHIYEEDDMTPEQIMLVQMSWSEIEPLAPKLGEVFYTKLFELAPDAKELFGADVKSQGDTLVSMLGVAINMLDKLAVIEPIVQDLGRRHFAYKVNPAHIKPFREALMYALEWALGPGFNNQVRDAWTELFDVLVHKMRLDATQATS
jgi:hemoglobin-like flavoprotein